MIKKTIGAHNTRVLFWYNLLGTISFIQPVLTLFYLSRGINDSMILWMMLAWSFAILVGEVPTGMIADRFGAKTAFITGSSVKIVSLSVLIFAHHPLTFFISQFLSGLSAAFFSGADEALIYDSLKVDQEEDRMDQAMGKIQSAPFLSMLFAVILGAVLAKDLTQSEFILLLGLGVLSEAVGIVILLFITSPATHTAYRDNPFKQVKEGVQVIRKTPQLLVMFLNVTLVFIPAGAIFGNFDQPFLQKAGLPVPYLGIVYAAAAILGFFASQNIRFLTQRFSRVFLLYFTGVVAALALLMAFLEGNQLFTALIVFFVLRWVRAIRYPIYSQLSNDWIPSHVRATTISLLSIIDSVADLFIFSLSAFVAVYGLSPLFLACAGIALIGTFLPIKHNVKETLAKQAGVSE
ncbi:MAG TPA: MFS transporter [Sporolactobacillaceae bacterium]|nr:MFS transporter [Sporolactobacillaceae bacterium]